MMWEVKFKFMKLILSNGRVINDAPQNSPKTIQYLKKFWRFPSENAVKKMKEKYYSHDCQREWQEDQPINKEIESESVV
jgi:hypothetical protein